ncbi:unnamed protein product [Soboliphyme baturini]|uniref:Transposase n=1 Tax=Soboliphyme baturini TaxID=241478 RepID=A0A183J9U6_9BILA|nr:unnamed protein product [Soboliphyme baturini]
MSYAAVRLTFAKELVSRPGWIERLVMRQKLATCPIDHGAMEVEDEETAIPTATSIDCGDLQRSNERS